MTVVIDTNVAVVANGVNTHACIECQLKCIDFLYNTTQSTGRIAIDESGLILNEYSKHFSYSGAPGVGDMFFKHIYDNQYNESKILQVPITQLENKKGFAELPENNLDRSDQKFLATAVASKATIVNATDSDWTEQNALLKSLEVEVCQLCPEVLSCA
jgi:predicted nucleic acid-binding protein